MSRDDAFAEYVTARWGALFRLAVLLVGDSDAEDLTQASLLKVYTAWSRVQAADSPDAYVKRIMVNTAVTEGRQRQRHLKVAKSLKAVTHADSAETRVVEQSAMWARLNELAPRQRAVIVLRYYEDMSETEIARTLGCARGTVKAHAAAAIRTLKASLASTEPETAGGTK